jgi:hypothetical protein
VNLQAAVISFGDTGANERKRVMSLKKASFKAKEPRFSHEEPSSKHEEPLPSDEEASSKHEEPLPSDEEAPSRLEKPFPGDEEASSKHEEPAEVFPTGSPWLSAIVTTSCQRRCVYESGPRSPMMRSTNHRSGGCTPAVVHIVCHGGGTPRVRRFAASREAVLVTS